MGHLVVLLFIAYASNSVHIFLQAFLAYGVPGNDIKLFSLMQKVYFTEHLFGYSHVSLTTF
jgi:hypothetical protein